MWHNLNAICSNIDNSTSWLKKDVFHARVFILHNKSMKAKWILQTLVALF